MHEATHQAYGHSARVFDVRFSPADSNIFASGSDDTTARVWIIEGEHVRQVLCCYGHTAEVLRLAWSRDGKLLATGSADGTVRVWQPRSSQGSYDGHQVAVLEGHPEEVYHVEFLDAEQATGSGRLLVASSESLFVWDVERQQMLQKADAPGTSGSTLTAEELIAQGSSGAYIFGCARQPACAGGKLVATACSDGQLRLWVLGPDDQLSFLHAAPLGAAMLTSCAFDSRGAWLACAARDGTIHVLDARTLSVIRTLRVPYVAFCCAFVRREGAEWLALSGNKGQLTLIDVEHPGTVPVCMSVESNYTSPLLTVSVSDGGDRMAAAGDAQVMAPVPVPRARAGSGSQGAQGPAGTNGQASAGGAEAHHQAVGSDAVAVAVALGRGGDGDKAAKASGPDEGSDAPLGGGAASAARAAAGAAARRRGRPKAPVETEPACGGGPKPKPPADYSAVDYSARMSALDLDPFGEAAPGAAGAGAPEAGGATRGLPQGETGGTPGAREERAEEAVMGVAMRAPIFVWKL